MKSGLKYIAPRVAVGLALLALAACGSPNVANIPTSSPTSLSVATAVATAQPAATAAAPTSAPAATAAPTGAPVATAAPVATSVPTSVPDPAQWTDYQDALGRWTISYPANVLSPVGIDDGLVVFISQDRGFFVGIDSRAIDKADAEALHARATKALTQIYASRPKTINKLEQTDYPWQAGVSFATAKGSQGTAVYTLAGSDRDKWAYGMIYGYKTAGSPKLREALEQTIAKLVLNPPTAGRANSAEDLPVEVQQPILDAAWAKLKPQHSKESLLIGLIRAEGDYAAALATPLGQRPLFVYLQRQAGTWQVVEASATPTLEVLRQKGIPDDLGLADDAYFVIDGASRQIQDPRGGLSGYVTVPRIAGDFARFSVSPADSEQRDGTTMFFKREGDSWRFLTAGSAFPQDDLRGMGVPRELWSYGSSVQGPR